MTVAVNHTLILDTTSTALRHNGHPHECISDFFAAFSLPEARTYLRHLLHAAYEKQYYKKESPGNLLYFVEELGRLLAAAFILVNEYDQHAKSILPKGEAPDITRIALYCRGHSSNPWHHFPRHLSLKEYRNPYRALQKLGRYQQLPAWNGMLHTLLMGALGRGSLYEIGGIADVLRVSSLLYKLLDAAHLIDVRELKNNSSTNHEEEKKKEE